MMTLQEIIDRMEPAAALREIAPAIKSVLGHLDEEARIQFVTTMIDDAGGDKVSSMVNLWLAECMDEGVDPTNMCQSLVHKVAQSKQLLAVTDPDILVLFENWLEELEDEVLTFMAAQPESGPGDLAERLGLSRSGAAFLLAKLRREGKL